MRIVIAGAGEVGSHLAKLLSFENQDIVLVDKDAEKIFETQIEMFGKLSILAISMPVLTALLTTIQEFIENV